MKAQAIDKLNCHITSHNMRKTPERYAILDKVFEMTCPFSIDTLHDMICNEGYYVSKVTVYNAINLFLEIGIVRKYSAHDRRTVLYEKISTSNSHMHLVCLECGKDRELKDKELERLIRTRRFGSFQPEYSDTYVYGLCGACGRRKKKAAVGSKPLE